MKFVERFRVEPGTKVKLDEVDADSTDGHKKEEEALDDIEKYCVKLRDLQYLLYAEGKRSLLICLQAMDAGGKDGTIKHVLGAMNPQGCGVQEFKVPSLEEAAHDFLWRAHKAVPAKGRVAIFNRSHYEDVLVVRVHGLVPEDVWAKRYDQINAFERELAANGTHILKFYLHIDKHEQLKRFKQRLDDPTRYWKISESDYSERDYWDDYMAAFEDALSRCSTDYAPWFIVPSNNKWYRNLVVSRIVLDTLEELGMKFPAPTVDITEIKQRYHDAKMEQANHGKERSRKRKSK